MINLYNLNIPCLRNKVLNVEAFLKEERPIDILCLNEHRLTKNEMEIIKVEGNNSLANNYCELINFVIDEINFEITLHKYITIVTIYIGRPWVILMYFLTNWIVFFIQLR